MANAVSGNVHNTSTFNAATGLTARAGQPGAVVTGWVRSSDEGPLLNCEMTAWRSA